MIRPAPPGQAQRRNEIKPRIVETLVRASREGNVRQGDPNQTSPE